MISKVFPFIVPYPMYRLAYPRARVQVCLLRLLLNTAQAGNTANLLKAVKVLGDL